MPNVSLTPELEKYLADKVKSGGYNNVSEVVREAVRNQQSYDHHLTWLRQEIAKGDADIAAGNVVEWDDDDDAFIAEIEAISAKMEEDEAAAQEEKAV